MGTRSAMSSGGTRVPHNLVMRRKDAYVCMGMMPGMIGTVIPAAVDEFRTGKNRQIANPFVALSRPMSGSYRSFLLF